MARNVGVFVGYIAGAHPVITIGDFQAGSAARVAAHQQDRRQRLVLGYLRQVTGHVGIGLGQHLQACRPQDVLGLAVLQRRIAQRLHRPLHQIRLTDERQVIRGRLVVVILGLIQPVHRHGGHPTAASWEGAPMSVNQCRSFRCITIDSDISLSIERRTSPPRYSRRDT